VKKDDGIFRTLLESAAEGIVVVDVEGLIVMVNGKAEELFSYQKEELLGQVVDILLPESRREVHRSHRAEYVANPRNRSMGIGLDLVARRRDGSEFPVEIALSHAGEGNEMLIMASVSDITQRKQWEAEKTSFMEARIRVLEETLHTFGEMAGNPEAPVTARMMGVLPLRESAAEALKELTEVYGLIMDEALERRFHKTTGSSSEKLVGLASRLGFLKATPRDVVDLHSTVLKEKGRVVPASRMQGYLEEGHFLLVELIGHLATYYRNRAFSHGEVGVRNQPEFQGKGGGEDGR
jgi:PAS domain S-box-containing protein